MNQNSPVNPASILSILSNVLLKRIALRRLIMIINRV
jgi:hypothetical protein